ncbi:MAG: ATP-binding cassette domain-containing protein [Proteobacteria bacterium]|nr:ATP-binding cassette domain-containing protein [Pseudomonadota bacterium]
MTALLALAVPLASQALVNTIAAGVSLQPLIVLTAAVLVGLLFAGLIQVLRDSLVEVLQQRVFARVALRLARNLPRVEARALSEHHGSELMNRFFDVLTVQKTWSKIMQDGPGAVVEIMIGLSLLSLYGASMLALALALVASGVFVLVLCSFGGLRTQLRESHEKYLVAGWLEEMSECQAALKLSAASDFALDRTDALVRGYVLARRAHFRVLLRHLTAHYLLQAVAIAALLGLGGWMVITQSFTLGQLVAAELVLMSVMKAADKLVKLVDPWYDLLTALEKVGVLLDLPLESRGERSLPGKSEGIEISAQSVRFAYGDHVVVDDIDLHILAGEKVVLIGPNGSGKTTFGQMAVGLLSPDRGLLTLDGIDVRDVTHEALNQQVSVVWGRNEIFDSTLESNVVLGRPHSTAELQQALEQAAVSDHLPWRPWTLLCVSHRLETVERADRVVVIEKGRIVEEGPPKTLLEKRTSRLRAAMALEKESTRV